MKGVTLSGRYTLERSLAAGGMGTVWLARDDVLHRPVAVKLLNEGLLQDERAVERFRREAMTAAAITHPKMANVFDFLEHNGLPGIVMEYVEGETLAARIARVGPLPPEEAVRIASGVLDALEAAHARGIIHRDIKPGNVLLTEDGGIKVTDFGIARGLGDSTLTQAGMLMGTPHYIAPEQVSGRDASPATDVYAVGAVLYEMLTGHKPFEADTPVAVALARLRSDPKPPRALRRSIPRRLEQVVMRALARDPDARFAGAHQMRRALGDAPDPTQLLEVRPTDPTVAIPRAGHEGPSRREPRALPVIVRRLRPWLLPAAAIALIASLAGLVATDRTGDTASAGPTKSSSPTTPAPSARAQPRTISAAVAALIDVVREGDRRDQIDGEVADDLVASARAIGEHHAAGDATDALAELRSLLRGLNKALGDGEITERRHMLVSAAITDLVGFLDVSGGSSSGSNGDDADDTKKKGKGKGKGRGRD